ncbi:prolipoprotein diacylglyceryl transferase family protein [Paramuribaculum intestinale]|uniref:prolipoprotein diacylglyceryl transferase family protein n=1 Tax=Paramuribaculum intestinale TaxID=2094151 RepID=UPI0025A55BEB|nr:prolipoprotein diacylglyceryl transferase family protein [Paramuribaculum intestinale]
MNDHKETIFISGIDTDAGKSYATGWLACQMAAQGRRVATMKFIQTGCDGRSEDIDHGGTIAIIIAVLLYSLFTTRRSPIWTFDRLVIPVALVAGLIRIGNLINSEIFGTATTLPWGFMFLRSRQWHEMYYGQACHPTQLYEALCYFILFALLMWMYWRKNAEQRPGLLFGVFLIGIFLPRFIIEFIKNDQTAFEADMALNMGQLLSIPFVIAGIVLVIWSLCRPKVEIAFPDRYADEPSDGKRRR